MKYIVDIKGEIEGDYEIIGKAEPEWIPCTPETMPAWGKLVWASINGAKVEMLKFYDNYWYSDNDDWMHERNDVDAWMPLDWPEPYKPKEDSHGNNT